MVPRGSDAAGVDDGVAGRLAERDGRRRRCTRRARRGRGGVGRGDGTEALRLPLFLGGELYRLNATVHPARLALGLRTKLLEHGIRIHERTEATKLERSGKRLDEDGTGRGRRCVLAVNTAAAGFPGYRPLAGGRVQGHIIVLTEPIPDVLDELGWTCGEAIVDSRTLVHYTRTTRDGRIVFGWGGGTMGLGGRRADRLELDRDVVASTRETDAILPPDARARGDVSPGGGLIDVSPTHCRSSGAAVAHHGFGFTGNGVGLSYLGGEILARLALDRRDERSQLAIVEPDRKLFPPSRSATRAARSSGGPWWRRMRRRTRVASRACRRASSVAPATPRPMGCRARALQRDVVHLGGRAADE